MKLIHKTTRYLLVVTLPIALIGTFFLDYLIHQTISNEIDELLISELKQVKENLDRHPPDARGLLNWDHNLQIAPAAIAGLLSPVFSDTTLVDPVENELGSVRMLRATHAVGGHYYSIRLHQPYLEFDEIAHLLSVGIVICFLALLAFLLFIETLIFKRILHPFYTIIQQLKNYRIDHSEHVTFPISNVDEFTLLSQALSEMTQRAADQYSQQKQFADNTSHELQTPLSILSFDLDLLQQSDRLSEADLQRIQRSQKTIKRLSSMYQALLLLTKIDNHQFSRSEPVHIGELVTTLVNNYAEYADHKGITLERRIKDNPVVLLNQQLAFILFSNLIKNAIRHGRANSSVLIQVSKQLFLITNEGEPLPFPEEKLFQRFIRNQAMPHSTGLGLAIVKEIGNQYGMNIQYSYDRSMQRHCFSVSF